MVIQKWLSSKYRMLVLFTKIHIAWFTGQFENCNKILSNIEHSTDADIWEQAKSEVYKVLIRNEFTSQNSTFLVYYIAEVVDDKSL